MARLWHAALLLLAATTCTPKGPTMTKPVTEKSPLAADAVAGISDSALRGVVADQGAYVTGVSERVRDLIGLEVGDVILQINTTVIRSANDVSRAIGQAPPRMMSRALIERGGRRYTTDFSIQ